MTLQIVTVRPDHLDGDPVARAINFQRGDINLVVLTPPHASKDGDDWRWDTPILSPRCGFIHMPDVPEERWQNMRRRFMDRLTVNNVSSIEDRDNAPDEEDPPTSERFISRRRRWRFDIPGLPAPKRNELLTLKETTYRWDLARDLIRRKTYTVIEDPDQDVYTPVADEDLPATP